MKFRNDQLCVLRHQRYTELPILGPFASADAARRWCEENNVSFHHYEVKPFTFVADLATVAPPDTGERYVVIRTEARNRFYYSTQDAAEKHAAHMLRARSSHRADFLYPPDGKFLVCRVVSVATDRVDPPIVVRAPQQDELPLAGGA